MATIGHAVLPIIAWLQFKLDLRCLASALFFAFLPDIDILISFLLTGNPFTMHRGLTHALAFALIPLILFMLFRKDYLLWGFFGAVSHPLVDFLDPKAIPLLWPIMDQKLSLYLSPCTFGTDLAMLAILILYLAYYFGRRYYDSVKQRR